MLLTALASFNQILASGISITAFSLLLYALTFNLRDRVARTFATLLVAVTLIYFFDVVVATTLSPTQVEIWLRLQWVGIAILPIAYLHFSDAILATTGLPSRGRRRFGVRVLYIVASGFILLANLSDMIIHDAVIESGAAHMRPGPAFPVFSVFFVGTLLWAGWNFARAYQRCQTSTTRRRMLYLMIAAAAPPLGAFPFLLVAGQTASSYSLTFWLLAISVNLAVTVLLLVMAYVVAYFGVTQPDRVVKARFFQWLLRGPVVASTLLTVYFVINHYGPRWPLYDARILPFMLIGVLLLVQFVITLVRVPIERMLFYGRDRQELQRLHVLEQRLLTSSDVYQFLEAVLASLCDELRVSSAFIASLGEDGKLENEVSVGQASPLQSANELPPPTVQRSAFTMSTDVPGSGLNVFDWNGYWLVALRSPSSGEALGLLGVQARPTQALTPAELDVLQTLTLRAVTALEDRRLQQAVFAALDRLLPKIEAIQRLRASAYSEPQTLVTEQDAEDPVEGLLADPGLAHLVKDALSHYWGGPKLTNSPLLNLRVVERALVEHDGNAVNALRAVLQQAIERVKPDGQRKFTTEWVLYNILELKFLQNRRVREVAMRLAVSEADLYRKQRLAVEQVARAIVLMEQEVALTAETDAPQEVNESVSVEPH